MEMPKFDPDKLYDLKFVLKGSGYSIDITQVKADAVQEAVDMYGSREGVWVGKGEGMFIMQDMAEVAQLIGRVSPEVSGGDDDISPIHSMLHHS